MIWVWVCQQLAAGAVSYIGGKAMESVLNPAPGTGPSNTDIINAVKQSVIELEKFFDAKLKQRLSENEITKMRGLCEAIDIQLLRYSGILDKHKKDYKDLIQQADWKTSEGIGEAKQFEPLSLPTFANFVSLRTITIQAFYELDRDPTPYKNFAKELRGHINFVSTSVKKYIDSLSPDQRIGPMSCYEIIRGSDNEFKVRDYVCTYSKDGENVKPIGGLSGDGSLDDKYRNEANDIRNRDIAEATVFRDDVITNFDKPLREVCRSWIAAADAIEKI